MPEPKAVDLFVALEARLLKQAQQIADENVCILCMIAGACCLTFLRVALAGPASRYFGGQR